MIFQLVFKKFGEVAGEFTGTVLGGTVKFVEEVTNSDFVLRNLSSGYN